MGKDQNLADQGVDVELLQKKLGYCFVDGSRLIEGLTHRSYANEQPVPQPADNERLEFLGDAVLSLAISDCLLRLHPDASEGVLTQARSELVNATSLAKIAGSLQLGDFLLLGRGELRSGGKSKDNLLADALEAVFGAIFLDGGYPAAAAVIELIFEPYLDLPAGSGEGDAKTRLQELLQGRHQPLPAYRLALVSGPDHQRLYEVEVLVNDQVLGRGVGGSKKRAEQAAAGQALEQLNHAR